MNEAFPFTEKRAATPRRRKTAFHHSVQTMKIKVPRCNLAELFLPVVVTKCLSKFDTILLAEEIGSLI